MLRNRARRLDYKIMH
ncbi:hypothetical protein Q0S55_03665 [Escherichia coli O88:H8]|nr:hypothetical protein [Escherichia coli]MDC4396969.1 hypothetical protein [Acinetobacter baumannii]